MRHVDERHLLPWRERAQFLEERGGLFRHARVGHRLEPERAAERKRVPREVELGHDAHAPRVGVIDDFPELLLRIELALVPMQERPLRLQLREALRLQAPGVVLGEVPMEEVELVARHRVDDVLHALRRQVVAHRVEHEPAPFETWPINDAAAW